MRVHNAGAALPGWVIAVAALAVIAIAGLLVLRNVAAPRTAGPGTVQVRPGMFDIRSEAAKGNLGGGLKTLNSGGQ